MIKSEDEKGSEEMAKVLAIANGKGGCAKTATTCSIGAGLAAKGKKVLLIDADQQGSLTESVGVQKLLTDEDVTIAEVLKSEADINTAIKKLERYDIIPADSALGKVEKELSSEPGAELILREKIQDIKEEYDYIIVDCPPALNLITRMALTAADPGVIVPVQPGYLALSGLSALIEQINIIKRRLNPNLDIFGMLLTFYDNRMVLHKEVKASLEGAYGDRVFRTTISNCVALAEAPGYGMDIFEYRPSSKPAQQYGELCGEILEKAGDK